MTKISKRFKKINELVKKKVYNIEEAISVLQATPKVDFVQTVEVAVNLGVDAKKSEQLVRGSSVLPNGTGKKVRVAVFTQGNNVESAKAAGADIVGFNDLAESIQAGNMDFDVVIASPDAMGVVGKLGQILGPRGLMPNPKVGTVTQDVATAVKNAKGGQVRYKTDKSGIVHFVIGKIDFDAKKLKENLDVVMQDLKRLKPSTSKGIYFKKLTLSSTMGPGLCVDASSWM